MAKVRRSAWRLNGIELTVIHRLVTVVEKNEGLGRCTFRVNNAWIEGGHNRSTITHFDWGGVQDITHRRPFILTNDAPPSLWGSDAAPSAIEHLLHALGACLTTSLVAHAAARVIRLTRVECALEGDVDFGGFLGLSDETPRGISHIRATLSVTTTEEDLTRIERLIAFSPVLDTLTRGTPITVTLQRG